MKTPIHPSNHHHSTASCGPHSPSPLRPTRRGAPPLALALALTATHPYPSRATGMWALNLKAGGPCVTPTRRPAPPPSWGRPLPSAGEAGPCSVAAAGRRRGTALVAVGASRRGSKDGPGGGAGDGGDDEAKGKASPSGNDDAASTGDSSDGLNQMHDESKSSEPVNISNSNYWRDVRANLVRREQELLVDPIAPTESKTSPGEPAQQLPQKWAHPITMPEAGCVLVATEVLDDDSIFERTVILLLRLGTRGTFDGPFGVILNRPLYTKIKHVNPSFQDQATPFGDSTLFFGGPVDMSMFLVRAADNSRLKGFEEVIPGIRFGFRTDLEKAAVLMKSGAIRSQDLRFFVGHAAWDYEQLLSEIRAGYWAVASCSTELISDALTGDPSCLWTEILQLMGGHYSELSQKPKQDDQ